MLPKATQSLENGTECKARGVPCLFLGAPIAQVWERALFLNLLMSCRVLAGIKTKDGISLAGHILPREMTLCFFGGGSHTGIVERVSGSTLHTIEGNTTNSVARRQYSLASSYVTGYGQVGEVYQRWLS